MRRLLLLPVLVLALVALTFCTKESGAQLEPSYRIDPRIGEWMVLAASYSGSEAEELSQQLVEQLRREHRLPAYVWNYADKDRMQLKKQLEKYKKSIRVEQHWGVLVGGFDDMEEAAEMMKKIRQLPLPKLRLRSGKVPYDTQWVVDPKGKVRQAHANPFRMAMVVRNPSVPRNESKKPKFDPLWTKLNAEEEYNLLECRKPWTLAIKQYNGAGMIKPVSMTQKASSILDKLWPFSKESDGTLLNAASAQAHELARVLRKLNFEAYVLHTRYNSIVTVGSFDSPNDPRIPETIKRIGSFMQQVRGTNNGRDPLQLFPRPMPMEVPRP